MYSHALEMAYRPRASFKLWDKLHAPKNHHWTKYLYSFDLCYKICSAPGPPASHVCWYLCDLGAKLRIVRKKTFKIWKRILVAEQSDGSLVLFRVPRELRDVGGELAAVVVLAAVVDATDLFNVGLSLRILPNSHLLQN